MEASGVVKIKMRMRKSDKAMVVLSVNKFGRASMKIG